MRHAANEVDLQITSLEPPSLENVKPPTPKVQAQEESVSDIDEVLEAVEISVETDSK